MKNQIKNRAEGGNLLAQNLTNYKNCSDVLVLALPRGGVPVAFEIASFLNAKLDICLVRKIGVPSQKELAMGAIAMGDIVVFNQEILQSLNITQETFNQVKIKEKQELNRREKKYRGEKPFPYIENQTIILVDDGIATGSTLEAALLSIKKQNPSQIIIAVPVAPQSICNHLAKKVDKIICLIQPRYFKSLSLWYDDFSQTTDEEVCELLNKINF